MNGWGGYVVNKAEQVERRHEWERRIAEYRSSGLGVREWCAANDVNPKRVWYWLRHFKAENGSESTTWLSVDVRKARGRSEGNGLVIRVGEADIEVKPRFDPDLLSQVVRALSAIC